jgi:hypothetical protein
VGHFLGVFANPNLTWELGLCRIFLVNFVYAQDLWHLQNIKASFEGLMEVFEKQTRSPGVKSCYEVRDILMHGNVAGILSKTL